MFLYPCFFLSIKFRLIVMSTNLEYRERERQRKRESRATGSEAQREKQLARERKNKRRHFLLEEQYEILQRRDASGHQGENERQ